MPKVQYENLRFQPRILEQIAKANEIIEEYTAEGYELTLRQLYYQFVSRDLLPNTQKHYKQLGNTISKARRAGMIDWNAIVDRTRFLRAPSTWDSPSDILEAVAHQFKHDRWKSQPHYVEVWFEKDALLGVFERPAASWRVPIFSCRGYPSDSEVWSAAQRLARVYRHAQKPTTILHFGDHDPSGLDMTRDIEDRLALFGAPRVEVRRLALNMPQIEQYNPPPNPAKESDSRFNAYRDEHGDESWELDALDPKVLNTLVREAVLGVIDVKAWDKAIRKENKARVALSALSDDYDQHESNMEDDGTIKRLMRRLKDDEDDRIEPSLGDAVKEDDEEDEE
jgi:hypothetical protein